MLAMNRRFVFSLWAVAASVAISGALPQPSFAGAQRPAMVSSQRDRARKLFSQGEMFFEAGRYDAALAAYNKAYTLTNLRGFLLNIGHCYARVGNVQQATKYYRFYLQRSAQGDKHRKAVEQAIATLTGKQPPRAEPIPSQSRRARTVQAATVASVEQPDLGNQGESATPEPTKIPLPQLALTETADESMTLTSSPATSIEAVSESQRWLWPTVGAVVLAAGATWFLLSRDGAQDVKDGSIGTLSR